MSGEPIAIIGSGCRFPGEASSPAKLWQLLKEPRDVLRKIDRYNWKAFYHPDGAHHGTTNVQDSYLLSEDHRVFDAGFFNVKPVEADAIDPMQRILMETVYEALESSGLTIEQLQGSDTAFYCGNMAVEYQEHLARDVNSLPTYFATGTSRAIISNRVSYFFDWHGPSMTIDTACSSSLIALHHAVQAIRNGESRIAVAAGADLILGPEVYIGESKLNMLSPNGRSRMWDADADGYARGEGFAVVFCKKLSDAINDDDRIECIVRETATNQDGRTKGITMPNPDAQVTMIRDAYRRAGLNLNRKEDRPQFFEAHGTGTPAGDPLEAEAISKAFFGDDLAYDPNEVLHVGSIKTIVGHTEGTAGLAGILKASLALQNGIIPPNMLFRNLSPKVKPFYGNLRIPTAPLAWPDLPADIPRRASVNSFGFGGSNAHAILEAYNPSTSKPRRQSKCRKAFLPFVFSAASERSLLQYLSSMIVYLSQNPNTDLRNLAWTLRYRRSAFPTKLTLSASSVPQLIDKLEATIKKANDNPNDAIGLRHKPASSRILAVFTGQGAQWPTMGKHLFSQSPAARDILQSLEEALSELKDRPDWSLTEELFKDAKISRLGEATISQPLCTAVQIVLIDLIRAAGIQFDAVVGHSSGEIAAAYAAGFLSAVDAIKIAYYRGVHSRLAVGPSGQEGAMLAAGTDFEDSTDLTQLPFFDDALSVGACNSSASVTLSGDTNAIEHVKLVLEDEKRFARQLKVDKAYHSRHMQPASTPYVNSLNEAGIVIHESDSRCLWFSSVDGGAIMKPSDKLKTLYWRDNMVNTVMFSQAVEAAVKELGPLGVALEIGPHPALKGPATATIQEFANADIPYLATLSRGENGVEALADTIGGMWKYMGPSSTDFTAYLKSISGSAETSVIRDLPSYCWEHDKIYWYHTRAARAYEERQDPPHELLGILDNFSSEYDLRWKNSLVPKEIPWLGGHLIQNQIVFPASGYVSMAVEAGLVVAAGRFVASIDVTDIDIARAISFDSETSAVETLCTLKLDHTALSADEIKGEVCVYACLNKMSGSLQLMSSCRILLVLGDTRDDVLPPLGEPEPNLSKVDVERFYKTMDTYGHNYKEEFARIASQSRKFDMAMGTIVRKATDGTDNQLLVYPPTLDVGFQAIFGAWWAPNDEVMWSTHLPRTIKRIRINPALCHLIPGEDMCYPYKSVLTSRGVGEVTGNGALFASHGQEGLFQIEGLRVLGLKGTDPDRQFYTEEVWDVAAPDLELTTQIWRADREEITAAAVSERIAYYYWRHLKNNGMPRQDQTSNIDLGLVERVSKVQALVKSGRHPSIKREWARDTYQQIEKLIQDGIAVPDIAMTAAAGRRLLDPDSQTFQPVDATQDAASVQQYWQTGLGLARHKNYVADAVRQITWRYPTAKVLEVGTSRVSLAEDVLSVAEHTIGSYTYAYGCQTDTISLPEHLAHMDKKVTAAGLDLAQDLLEQDFEEEMFDIILLPFAFGEGEALDTALTHLRRVLKPGGFLLVLDSMTSSIGRLDTALGALASVGSSSRPPNIASFTQSQYEVALRKSGFTGIDNSILGKDATSLSLSIILSQAADERVEFLRRPLQMRIEELDTQDLLIVGGASYQTSRLVEGLREILSPRFRQISVLTSLDDLADDEVLASGTIISLTDLDEPLFQNFTKQRWKNMKTFFDQARNLIWVAQGGWSDNPYAAMTTGFWRSVAHELQHVRLQSLDFAIDDKVEATIIAESLLRLIAYDHWDRNELLGNLLHSCELELVVEGGKHKVSRIIPATQINDRLNTSRRHVTSEVAIADTILELESVDTDMCILAQKATTNIKSDVENSVLNLRYCTSTAIEVAAGTNLFVGVGIDVETGAKKLLLTNERQSKIQVSRQWTIDCPAADHEDSHWLMAATAKLLAHAVLSSVSNDATIALLNPTLIQHAAFQTAVADRHIRVISVTADSSRTSHGHRYIHPATSQFDIQRRLPEDLKALVNLSSEANGLHLDSLRLALPANCTIIEHDTMFAWRSKYEAGDSTDAIVAYALQAMSNQHHYSLSRHPADSGFIVGLEKLTDAEHKLGPNSIIDWTYQGKVIAHTRDIDSNILFHKDRSYFLVGMTGELGRSICLWMAQHGAGCLILTSRNPSVDPRWVEEVEATGATVKVYSMDVTNYDSVHDVLDHARQTLPPIAGVANAAMLMRDQHFLDMDFEAMDSSLKPKVDGSNVLNDFFQDDDLDFFILFSSVACIIGNDGQCNYTAGNQYMCALARQRRKQGLVASVMDIGRVVGVGYLGRVDASVDDRLRKLGMKAVSEYDVHHIFAEAVVAGRVESGRNPELITGLGLADDIDEASQMVARWRKTPRFSIFMAKRGLFKSDRGTAEGRVPVKVALQDASSKEQANSILQDIFAEKMEVILQLPSGGVNKAVPLIELGVDSLVAVEIRTWMLKELNVDLPVLRVLSGASVTELAELAVNLLPESALPNLGSDVTKKVEQASAKPPLNGINSVRMSPSEPIDTVSSNLTPEPGKRDAMTKIQSYTTSPTSATMNGGLTPRSDGSDRSDSTSVTSVSDGEEESKTVSITDSEPCLQRTEPASSSQASFWFLRLYKDDPTTFNVTFYHRVSGRLRTRDLERAVREVGQHHEALRTCFFASRDALQRPSQGVMAKTKLHLEKKHISDDTEAVREYDMLKGHVYDLRQGETMRIILLTKSLNEHFILWGHDHIIMDGISFQTFLVDLNRAYSRQPLDQKVLQYPDFSSVLAARIESGALESQIAYWKEEYSDKRPVLALFPIAQVSSRRPLKEHKLNISWTRLQPALAAELRKRCAERRSTAFHFHLAVFTALLNRFSGQDDFAIGIADANRRDAGTLGSIGSYLNMFPLRVKTTKSANFAQLLSSVRDKTYTALGNADVPFDVLLNELKIERTTTHSPIFQAFFDYRQGAKEDPTLCGCQLQIQGIEAGRTPYDISLDVTESKSGALVSIKTQDYIYSQQAAEQILRSYVHLLEQAVRSPDTTLHVLSLYPSEDVRKAIDAGKGRVKQSTWPETLVHRVEAIAVRYAEDLAVQDDTCSQMTYNQLLQRTNVVAHALVKTGVQVGSNVAIFQHPSAQWVPAMLAIMKIGAVYIPLDLRNPLPRLAAILKNCRASAVIVDAVTTADIAALSDGDLNIVNASTLDYDAIPDVKIKAHGTSPAAVLFTSGSTGTPKGMVLRHAGLVNMLEGFVEDWHIGREKVLQQSALSFDHSLDQIFTALTTGGTLYVATTKLRGDAVALSQLVRAECITYTKATPTEYASWIQYGGHSLEQAQDWRRAVAGGEVFPTNLLSEFQRLNLEQLEVLQGYGPAECSISATKIKLNYRGPVAGALSVGRPMPNYEIFIVDEDLRPVPLGVVGAIVIGGPGVCLGYLEDDDLNQEHFISDNVTRSERKLFKTGDRGRLDEGGYVFFEGRIDGDTQIKLRGLRIDLRDIESGILQASQGDVSACVCSLRGSEDAQFLVAHVEFLPSLTGDKDAFVGRLRTALTLPPYMVPALIIPIEEMPQNNHHKIDRRAISMLPLPEMERKRPDNMSLTDTERHLISVWEETIPFEVLKMHRLDRLSDFFAVGGNSLSLVKLQHLIRKTFDTTLPLAEMFEATTVSAMAAKIDASITIGTIDWAKETSVPTVKLPADGLWKSTPRSPSPNANTHTIILTGATGYLGSRILQRLINVTSVSAIYCIAVRNPTDRIPPHPKVTVHDGAFELPSFGLRRSTVASLSQTATSILHIGARRSYWDNYHQLRGSNVQSTKTILRFAAARKIPIHFVSSGGVVDITGTPPNDGTNGYVASKWASEQLLKAAAAKSGVESKVYRFARPKADENDEQLLKFLRADLLKHTRSLKILPERAGWNGVFDLIPSADIVKTIVDTALKTLGKEKNVESTLKNIPAVIRLDIKEAFSWIVEEGLEKEGWQELHVLKWVGKLKKSGFEWVFAAHDVQIEGEGVGGGLVHRR